MILNPFVDPRGIELLQLYVTTLSHILFYFETTCFDYAWNFLFYFLCYSVLSSFFDGFFLG